MWPQHCVFMIVCFSLWTRRKKKPTKKGSWWLTELKLKNKQNIGDLSVKTVLQEEACTMFLPSETALINDIREFFFNQ